jgi:hypothetical protein
MDTVCAITDLGRGGDFVNFYRKLLQAHERGGGKREDAEA